MTPRRPRAAGVVWRVEKPGREWRARLGRIHLAVEGFRDAGLVESRVVVAGRTCCAWHRSMLAAKRSALAFARRLARGAR